jgi:Uma2 family endonuclease
MPAGDPAHKRATLADLSEAEAQGRRVELLGGEIVEKEAAGNRHSGAHGGVFGALHPPFRGRGGGERPGGWSFRIDASITAPDDQVVQPDIAGWHRERAPRDDAFPLTVTPDWVCELVYASQTRDIVQKPKIYHSMHVNHYWVMDLKVMTLTVYRWSEPGFVFVVAVGPEGKVRLEPFDAIELDAAELFGMEEP